MCLILNKVQDHLYKRINSATFSFYTFSENELMNQIVPFTIYFELKFHSNLTILKVTTSFCCLPPLAPPCAWFITDLGQVLTSTGARLAPGWHQAVALMAPCWHANQTFAGRPYLQDLKI